MGRALSHWQAGGEEARFFVIFYRDTRKKCENVMGGEVYGSYRTTR